MPESSVLDLWTPGRRRVLLPPFACAYRAAPMTLYRYKALNTRGETLDGTMEAGSEAEDEAAAREVTAEVVEDKSP